MLQPQNRRLTTLFDTSKTYRIIFKTIISQPKGKENCRRIHKYITWLSQDRSNTTIHKSLPETSFFKVAQNDVATHQHLVTYTKPVDISKEYKETCYLVKQAHRKHLSILSRARWGPFSIMCARNSAHVRRQSQSAKTVIHWLGIGFISHWACVKNINFHWF